MHPFKTEDVGINVPSRGKGGRIGCETGEQWRRAVVSVGGVGGNHGPSHIACPVVSESGSERRDLYRIVEGRRTSWPASIATNAGRRPRLGIAATIGQPTLETHDREETFEIVRKFVAHRDLRNTLPQITGIAHDRKVDVIGQQSHNGIPVLPDRERGLAVIRRIPRVGETQTRQQVVSGVGLTVKVRLDDAGKGILTVRSVGAKTNHAVAGIEGGTAIALSAGGRSVTVELLWI